MSHLRLVRRNDDAEPVRCRCEECGKTWLKGDQGDNETLCLRCEYIIMSSDEPFGDYEGEEGE